MPRIQVSGEISTVVNDKFHYVKFWERYDFKGQESFRIWTAWLDRDLSINEGDFVELEGDLTTKVGTYNKEGQETRQVVEHMLNNVTIRTVTPGKAKTETKTTQVRTATDILTQKDAAAEIDMPF